MGRFDAIIVRRWSMSNSSGMRRPLLAEAVC
jgi:hypothetical protein